jgi:hypothetical protein
MNAYSPGNFPPPFKPETKSTFLSDASSYTTGVEWWKITWPYFTVNSVDLGGADHVRSNATSGCSV